MHEFVYCLFRPASKCSSALLASGMKVDMHGLCFHSLTQGHLAGVLRVLLLLLCNSAKLSEHKLLCKVRSSVFLPQEMCPVSRAKPQNNHFTAAMDTRLLLLLAAVAKGQQTRNGAA